MIIVISRPELVDSRLSSREVTLMTALLDQGLGLLHVRKPAANFAALTSLIDQFKLEDRPKIVLHPPKDLLRGSDTEGRLEQLLQWMRQMGLYRLHIPAWLRVQATEPLLSNLRSVKHRIVLSTGIHTPAEFDGLFQNRQSSRRYDYVLVSPLFDSLSKSGYKANPDLWRVVREDENRYDCGRIAMGGIQARNLPAIRNAGFDGAALLGAIWRFLDVDKPSEWEKKITGYFKICSGIWKNTETK